MTHEGPSPHLSWPELACHDEARTPYPLEWRDDRALVLAAAFEDFRDRWALPIPILSGYRTPEHNEWLRQEAKRLRRPLPALYSQHMDGLALDLGRPRGVTLKELHDGALAEAKLTGSLIRGVGLYLYGVHIDCRESLRLVVWRGKRMQAEVRA